MPIRIASVTHQLKRNGASLHAAMMRRIDSGGADQPPSAEEQALLDERQALKETRAQRQAQARQPKPKAVSLAKEPKPKKEPKAPKAKGPKEPKEARPTAKGHMTRTEKAMKKAETLDAAKKASRKPHKS
jgi:hypothetical protein